MTPDVLNKYAFLPKREMAVHPLVPDKHDSPTNLYRLQLAVYLFSHCGDYLPEKKCRTYLLYLQHYFLCKEVNDIEILYDYHNLIQRYSQYCTELHSYKEADLCIASVEKEILNRGLTLNPYTSSLFITVDRETDDDDDDETMEIYADNETDAIVSSNSSINFSSSYKNNDNGKNGISSSTTEDLNIYDLREAEVRKQIAAKSGAGNRRIDMDNMDISMESHNEVTETPILLIRDKRKVSRMELHIHLTEDEKHRLDQQARYQERENRRMKKKALELHKAQMTEDISESQMVETIHNERVPVCPQSRGQRRRYY